MARVVVVATTVVLAMLFAGCETQETRTVHKSSIESQFAQLNKNGWSVTSPGAAQKTSTPNREVRVVKEADFSGLQFHTNFQIDDPKIKEQQAQREREEAVRRGPAPAEAPPTATPFGTMTPGR